MNGNDLGAELAELQPKTKVGKLRKYMPMIEQKLSEGATAQDMVEVLKKHGIDLAVGTFRYYLHQYRKQKKAVQVSNFDEKNQQSEIVSTKEVFPMSVQELAEVMQPDPNKLAVDIAEKERLYKEHEKSLKRKK